MAYEPCRRCTQLRKVGDYITAEGEHVPACRHCGDPEYYYLHPAEFLDYVARFIATAPTSEET